MRIAHVCLAGAYTEGMSYQDNMLVDINRRDGHEVLVVSDCMKFQDNRLVETPPEDYLTANGARLVRLPFDWTGPRYLTNKIKRCSRLMPLLEEFAPDVILYHGVIGWELLTLGKYKEKYPETRIYVDSHEDRHNSGTNWVSYTFQYRILTRWLIWRVQHQIEKIFCISLEVRDFMKSVLDLPDEILEYYPLGGIVIPDEERRHMRRKQRELLGLADTDILFFHSGKLDRKKRTLEILNAFRSIKASNARLLIAGSIEDDARDLLEPAIAADNRVIFLGWKGREDLSALMCAVDVYVQPGGQSVSLQHAICSGLPVLVFPYPSHEPFLRGNGFFVRTEADMADRMAEIAGAPENLPAMRTASYEVAYDLLDYRKLAARIYQ